MTDDSQKTLDFQGLTFNF